MYFLISAIAKPIEQNSRWTDISIGNIELSTLFQNYSKVYAVLSNSFLPTNVCLDLEELRADFADSLLTFDEFLTENGNKTLPTTTTIPNIDLKYAKYADAFHAGYKITPFRPLTSVDAELPISEKTSLHLTRPNTDYSLFLKHCMVSVNGYYHFVDGGAEGIVVQDGMKTLFVSNMNQIGILSFREVADIQAIPIKKEMLYKPTPNQPYRERLHIDTGVDLTGKTVILVIGGYMHIRDPKTFRICGKTQLSVDVPNLPLLERYFESMEVLDLSGLPLQKTSRNPGQVAVADFYSDNNLEAYFTMSQSFIVLLDNDDIFVEKQYVRKTRLPNMYISYVKPVFPMVVGYGKATNYWYTYEDKQYAVNCTKSLYVNYLFHTVDLERVKNISNARNPSNPVENSLAYFLKIGTQL